MKFDPRLCVVIGPTDTKGRDVVAVALAAVAGGATMIQLRWKDAADRDLEALARRLIEALGASGVPLIVNDRAEVARASGAAGVHLGQADMAPAQARAMLGDGAIIGWSIDRLELATRIDDAVDYVGIGPIKPTATKSDHKTPLGVQGFGTIRAAVRRPAMAIGGVTAAEASPLRSAGADGLAVVSAICGADDPETAARGLRTAFGR
ncbi:MAG: thiamine phosphate synthase [Alphaproteobacteria bacterium]|nr:thiamine phosphate synthase [Alphaproteobacteria bacterium]